MAATETTYSVLPLADAARDHGPGAGALLNPPDPAEGARGRVRLRQRFGIESFGGSAVWVEKAGANVVFEHDEMGPAAGGHEELYVVLSGAADFVVDGDELHVPQGTAVFVRPGTKRKATATEDGTTILAVGAKPGEAFRPSAGEARIEFYPLYAAKDYEGALSVTREALEEHPGNALVLYNLACLESLLGEPEPAIEHLGAAVEAWPAFRESAAADGDFASLRDDARFQALVA
jgi:hypothetical protein